MFKLFNFSAASVVSQSFSFLFETYIKANIRGQRFNFISGFNSFYDKQFEIYIFAMVGLKVKALSKCNHNSEIAPTFMRSQYKGEGKTFIFENYEKKHDIGRSR